MKYLFIFIQRKFSEFLNDDFVLVVSSTSWTGIYIIIFDDEDFGILLESFACKFLFLLDYDKIDKNKKLKKIMCIITGKPCDSSYLFMEKYEKAKLENVKIFSGWFSFESYSEILSFVYFKLEFADLGVCMHKSSSGLDLPMKVDFEYLLGGRYAWKWSTSMCLRFRNVFFI